MIDKVKLNVIADKTLYTETPKQFGLGKLSALITDAVHRETGEHMDGERLADRALQRAKKKGHAEFVRNGRWTIWFLTNLGMLHAAGYSK